MRWMKVFFTIQLLEIMKCSNVHLAMYALIHTNLEGVGTNANPVAKARAPAVFLCDPLTEFSTRHIVI